MNKMSSYIIEGGRRLEGEVEVSGWINAYLPRVAGQILKKGNTKVSNIFIQCNKKTWYKKNTRNFKIFGL